MACPCPQGPKFQLGGFQSCVGWGSGASGRPSLTCPCWKDLKTSAPSQSIEVASEGDRSTWVSTTQISLWPQAVQAAATFFGRIIPASQPSCHCSVRQSGPTLTRVQRMRLCIMTAEQQGHPRDEHVERGRCC